MLYIVLILVLGALGLLITALVTAASFWAWVSIGLSALAGVLLVVDVLRRRARRGTAPGGPRSGEVESPPDEEESAPADVEIVSGLDAGVVVVDEFPRYHLDDCSWLGERDTIRLPVREARKLGFTPCALCAPDASLARTASS
ncbi:hypothetical protein [Amycolatopsis pigmentata]|uniref:Uncharacterized protein n=1 Tax=Amycolatopsis pigmentata TaxID=450801 RepID=A0ABW5G8W5_9PSEU